MVEIISLPEEEILLLLATEYCVFGFWVGLMRKEHSLGVFPREFASGCSGRRYLLNST